MSDFERFAGFVGFLASAFAVVYYLRGPEPPATAPPVDTPQPPVRPDPANPSSPFGLDYRQQSAFTPPMLENGTAVRRTGEPSGFSLSIRGAAPRAVLWLVNFDTADPSRAVAEGSFRTDAAGSFDIPGDFTALDGRYMAGKTYRSRIESRDRGAVYSRELGTAFRILEPENEIPPPTINPNPRAPGRPGTGEGPAPYVPEFPPG